MDYKRGENTGCIRGRGREKGIISVDSCGGINMETTLNRKEIVEYEDAPSGAIKLYNYKQPFMPVENGYGYMGVLMHDAEHNVIQCHCCGKWMKTMSNHIGLHGFHNVREYKEKYGLAQTTALISDDVREKLICVGKKVTPEKRRGYLKLSRNVKQDYSNAGKHHKSIEKMNNEGTCPLQLVDTLDKIKEKLGHEPTYQEIKDISILNGKEFNSSTFLNGIKYNYGSFTKMREVMNWTETCYKGRKDFGGFTYRIHTKESLMALLKNFVIVHKRFPSFSDVKRKLLPCLANYDTYCGGLRKAKEELLLELLKNSK